MKFNYVIGNPPYQKEAENKSETNGQASRTNIFHFFQLQADKISKNASCLIYPGARWIHQSGKGVEEFGKNQINDRRLQVLKYYPSSQEIFGNVVEDGISIVLKNQEKTTDGFKYIYHTNNEEKEVFVNNPGNNLMPLDPTDSVIVNKIIEYMTANNLPNLNEGILPRSLFGIESDFVEKNPNLVRLYDQGEFDRNNEIKLFTNDKAGKSGRAKWYIANRNVIEQNTEYINKWKVVASSAKPGGHQGRDNQLEIMDNYSAFGRTRVAFKVFNNRTEAKNFYNYCKSYFVRYALLMTDDALSSVAKCVPDFLDYSNTNDYINYNNDIDEQINRMLSFSQDEVAHIKDIVDNAWNKEAK